MSAAASPVVKPYDPQLVQQAAAACAKGSKSFYFATRFFPPHLAASAHAVYWFCRHSDDMVDQASDPLEARRNLIEWMAATRRAFDGQAENPVLKSFAAAAQRHAIPLDLPMELLEGMRMDLDLFSYRTFDDLWLFCYRVASVVGLMMSHVIGFEPEYDMETARPFAIDLGVAMQLTNILRDVGEDLARGHTYLPMQELDQFGVTLASLEKHLRTDAFRELMKFQVERARSYYQRSQPGIPMLHQGGRFSVQIASDVYAAILYEIESNDFQVFEKRAVVPARRKYWITAKRMSGPMLHSVWQKLTSRNSAGAGV
jgi:15-cis-phytoene synthase